MLTRKEKNLRLIIALAITLGGSWLSGLFFGRKPDGWYEALIKPDLTPPGYVFGPVWALLYILMAFSLWGVWCYAKGKKGKAFAITIFFVQLAINLTWGYSFFVMHHLLQSFIHIAVMLVAILWTIILFWKQKKWASILLCPYFLWVSFAGYLSFFLWYLNS